MSDGQPSDNHLIVLRGNSASGKTTIASMLQTAMGPGTANIGQDHFRRVVLREHELPGGDNIGLIAHTIRYCTSVDSRSIVVTNLIATFGAHGGCWEAGSSEPSLTMRSASTC